MADTEKPAPYLTDESLGRFFPGQDPDELRRLAHCGEEAVREDLLPDGVQVGVKVRDVP